MIFYGFFYSAVCTVVCTDRLVTHDFRAESKCCPAAVVHCVTKPHTVLQIERQSSIALWLSSLKQVERGTFWIPAQNLKITLCTLYLHSLTH